MVDRLFSNYCTKGRNGHIQELTSFEKRTFGQLSGSNTPTWMSFLMHIVKIGRLIFWVILCHVNLYNVWHAAYICHFHHIFQLGSWKVRSANWWSLFSTLSMTSRSKVGLWLGLPQVTAEPWRSGQKAFTIHHCKTLSSGCIVLPLLSKVRPWQANHSNRMTKVSRNCTAHTPFYSLM